MEELINCPFCGKEEEYGQMYEYRGALSCGDCLEKATEKRYVERAEVIEEQRHKTDRFKGLDLSNSQIGKANKEILKQDIEVAKKESLRLIPKESQLTLVVGGCQEYVNTKTINVEYKSSLLQIKIYS